MKKKAKQIYVYLCNINIRVNFTIFAVNKHADTYICMIRYCSNLLLDIHARRIYTCQDLNCHFQLFQDSGL